MKIMQQGKKPRSDDSSHQRTMNRFYLNILPWETRISLKINILKVVVIPMNGLGALLVASNMGVSVLPVPMVVFHVVIRSQI